MNGVGMYFCIASAHRGISAELKFRHEFSWTQMPHFDRSMHNIAQKSLTSVEGDSNIELFRLLISIHADRSSS